MLGVSGYAEDASTPAPEHVRLQLKWQHQFQFAGYYAAVAQGYYREAGLEVELMEAEPGRDPVQTVLKGGAEYGVGTSELMLLRGTGQPVVVLAAIFQHSPLVLVALHRAGVNDLHDLHDKPMMIEPQSAELFAYFRNEGVDPKTLHIVHHTFSTDDLLQGRVAAMSAYSTDEPFTLRAAGVDFLTFTPRAGGIDFYGDNLFTTEGEIRQHPARARAFRQASLRGWDYALAHPQEMIDLILREHGRRKSRTHLEFEAEQTALLMHPGLIEVGHMNPGRWRHIADTYAEFGMLPRDFPLDGFLYEADPRPNLRWLYWALAAACVLAVAGFGWLLPMLRLNRRLARSERQYRELAENAPFPVTISSYASSEMLYANRRAGELLGANAGIEGERAADYYENITDRDALVADLGAGRTVTDREVCFVRRDGRRVWTLLSAGTIEFQGQRAIVIAVQDITARRTMEEDLRKAKGAAEAASAAKGRYLAVMSHEIRTPLNGMLGLIAQLRTEPLPAPQREDLEMMERSGQALLTLITNLLDFSQLDAGHVELEERPVAVADLLRDLSTLFRAAAGAKGVDLRHTVRPEVPPVILTDELRLRQILSNLLSNAIKFTATGTVEIMAELMPARETDAPAACRLRFHVTDTGIGLSPDQMARLFEPYAQGDATVARRYGGTGLGLSISKRLAQLLGGGIMVQSTPGEGAIFSVEILTRVASIDA
ncbi:MAG: ABC transporter substrate-binding protein [Verrucomicrobia bacterium]|nr:ABC transporter substrate-binding protein [Verrucomicrobiota bacterium]